MLYIYVQRTHGIHKITINLRNNSRLYDNNSLEYQRRGALVGEQHRRRRIPFVDAAQFGAHELVVVAAAAAAAAQPQRAALAAFAVEAADGDQPVHLQLDALAGRRTQQVPAHRRTGQRRRLDLAERQAGAVLEDARVQRYVAHWIYIYIDEFK